MEKGYFCEWQLGCPKEECTIKWTCWFWLGLIFPITACTCLHVRFLLETELITQTYISYCSARPTHHQNVSATHLPHQPRGWWAQGVKGGTELGRLASTDPQNDWSMVFVLPNHHYMWWGPTLLEMAECMSALGKWLSLLHFMLAHKFSHIYTSDFLPHLVGGEWPSSVVAVKP